MLAETDVNAIEEQPIDLLMAQALASPPATDQTVVNLETRRFEQEPEARRDYTDLVRITQKYFQQVDWSIGMLGALPCACADHGTASHASSSLYHEASFSLLGTIFSNTYEQSHEHCKTCGRCLKDGKCPHCDGRH